jgi:predicted dehydrogenase
VSHRVLVIGVGSIGERHLRCFVRGGRAGVSVCEPNDELRRRIAREYQVERSFGELDDFIADPPDAAVICTPSPSHIPIATRLADAGVHLLIEKPLSTSTDGIEQLTALCKCQRLTVAVAYVLRASPALSAMRDAIRSGRFGDPVQLVFASGQNFPFFRPAYREIYYASRATGGGAIQDALTHGINAAEWLVGPMTEVAADADHQLLDGVDVEDTAHVIARHGSVMASYSLNQYQAANETTFTVVCSEGTLRCQLHRARWDWQTSPESDWSEGGHHPVERDEMFVAQANTFLDAIEQQSQPLCTLGEGLQTLRANLAILRAADTRSWQSIEAQE